MVRHPLTQVRVFSRTNRTIILLATSALLGTLLFGACAWAQQPDPAPSRLLELTSDFSDAGAHWTVLSSDHNSLRLELRLSSLRVRDIAAAGETWQELTIDRGGLAGREGAPGLPTVSRLVAVPADVLVSARITDFKVHHVEDLRLMPIQPTSTEQFRVDSAAYSQTDWQQFHPSSGLQTLKAFAPGDEESGATPVVYIGAPALIAGQAVLPLTVGPVSYDPVSRTAVVASRMEIELRFNSEKSGSGLLSPVGRRGSPGPAFQALLQDQITGFSNKIRNGTQSAELGTWVVICRDIMVESHLAPLIDWRARQGYHVEVITSSGSAESIKDELQDIYDDTSLPPLEFIVLAGDTESAYRVPTWHESLSGFNGEGDHYYTTLDGVDILADAHIGRLSFTSLSMLDTILNKITAYEQNPPMNNVSWFRSACLMGDPADSGITTIYVNQWLKGQLLANGYAQVDTIWSGNFATQMMTSVNNGVSALGYRGYWNMSGISPGHISVLGNGGRLPVAILPTCETGSFEGSSACHSEAWLRAPGGGAIAAVGTATGGTHTRYNNCFYQGIWDGLLNAGDPRIGSAHTLGKIELYNNYFLAEPESAEIWAVWNNIMGDGASQIWQGVPRILTVDHPGSLSIGSNAVEVLVESEGLPIADALVCLYRADEIQVTGRTNSSGLVLLPTPALTEGSIQVTVTGKGLLPYISGLQVGVVDVFCGFAQYQIDDDALGASNGNGDSLINPGETIEMSLAVTNHGTTTAFGVSGVMTGGYPWSIIDLAELGFGEVAAGGTTWSTSPAEISINPSAPDGVTISWPLQVTDGINSWTSVVQSAVHAAALSVTEVVWSAGSLFEPGQSGQLTVNLLNDGSIDADAVSMTLSSDSSWLQVAGDASWLGDIDVGTVGNNSLDPFNLEINSACFAGHLAVMRLEISYNNGMQTSTEFTITVGTVDTDDPTGPDTYGYYAFDNSDTESFLAPVYEWVDLDPNHLGPGVEVGLTDFGWEEDDTKTIDLPFTFRYYGVDFDRASICSNGWMAMGETPLVHYRNFSIPAKGSPGSLIAPFWDNLNQTSNGRVYSYYDEAAHRYIVQWYQMLNHYSNAIQNFEVILLDPAWYPTATGDGIIIFQYEKINNTDSRDGYGTVGIQNHDRTDGVLYSYWNQYAPGAATLQSGLAIRFQPMGDIELAVPEVSPAVITESLKPGDSTQQTLHITNSGPEGTLLSFQIKKVDPATLMPDGSDKSIQGSTMTFSVGEYEPGATMDLEVAVHAVAPEGILSLVHLQIPPGVTLNSGEDLMVDGSPRLRWDEEVGEGVFTTWDGQYGGYIYYIHDGSTANATINLTFDSDLAGDLEFSYSLVDEGYFSPADQVDGIVVMTNDNPSVRITSPDADTVAEIGTVLDVEFEMLNASGLVDITLKRQPEGPWQTLVHAADAASGIWGWLVEEEPGPYAVIRVADSEAAEIFDESEIFVIGRNLDWVQLSQTEGIVEAGQTQDIILTLDAADLDEGEYVAVLIMDTNSGDSFSIPVDLLVSVLSETGEGPPQAVALLGNYPNPFNPSTTFSFTLPSEMRATLEIFSARGMLVRRLLDGRHGAGLHHVVWDGTDNKGRLAPSGVYFCRLVTPESTMTEKMVLAK